MPLKTITIFCSCWWSAGRPTGRPFIVVAVYKMDNFNWNSPPFNFVCFFFGFIFWFEGALKLGKFSLSPLRQSPWPVADVDFSFECYWLQSCFYEIIGLKISQIVTDKHSFEFCWCPPPEDKEEACRIMKKENKTEKNNRCEDKISTFIRIQGVLKSRKTLL